jgi:hypothetical protein
VPSEAGLVGAQENKMYTGTLIEDLIATVERVERRVSAEIETAELERLYLVDPSELVKCDQLVGVA